MATIELSAKTRSELRKGLEKKRIDGIVPAVIYGPKRKSTAIYIDEKEFRTIFEKAEYTHLIDMLLDGKKTEAKVLIREVQLSPLGDKLMHVGLFELDMTHTLTVSVPVHVKGFSPAEKNNIGILVTPVSELTVRCLPKNIPDEFMIDLSILKQIGDAVKIEDLKLPEGVEWVSDVDLHENLAFIVPPQKEEVIEAATELAATPESEAAEAAAAEEGATEIGEDGEVAEGETPEGKKPEAPAEGSKKKQG